jgi:protease I
MAAKVEGKTVAMLVANEFEDIELLYPLLRLSEEGAAVLVSALPTGFHPRPFLPGKPVTGRFGTPVPIPVMPEGPHYRMAALEDLRPEEINCLFIPGGFAPDYLRRTADVLELVRQCAQRGALLASICHGPWVFISAGVVKGKRATGIIAVRDDLINAGAVYEDAPAVRDGNLITARGPNDLPDLCREIIAALAEQAYAR